MKENEHLTSYTASCLFGVNELLGNILKRIPVPKEKGDPTTDDQTSMMIMEELSQTEEYIQDIRCTLFRNFRANQPGIFTPLSKSWQTGQEALVKKEQQRVKDKLQQHRVVTTERKEKEDHEPA